MSFTTAKALLFLAGPSMAALGQTFEVASIRASGPLDPQAIVDGKMSIGMRMDAGRVWFNSLSLQQLIPLAYQIKPYQLTGPNWLSQQRFDIQATLPEGTSREQIPAPLRALLQGRFNLRAHTEEKELNVYALTVAKGGAKMKPAAEDDSPEGPSKAEPAFGVNAMISLNGGRQGIAISASGNRTGLKRTAGPNGTIHFEIARVTMPDFVEMVSPLVDRPVVDRTGLAGSYQVAFDLSTNEMALGQRPAEPGSQPTGSPEVSDPAGGTIFRSVQQLGLRIERAKASVPIVVVDSVEKQPAAN